MKKTISACLRQFEKSPQVTMVYAQESGSIALIGEVRGQAVCVLFGDCAAGGVRGLYDQSKELVFQGPAPEIIKIIENNQKATRAQAAYEKEHAPVSFELAVKSRFGYSPLDPSPDEDKAPFLANPAEEAPMAFGDFLLKASKPANTFTPARKDWELRDGLANSWVWVRAEENLNVASLISTDGHRMHVTTPHLSIQDLYDVAESARNDDEKILNERTVKLPCKLLSVLSRGVCLGCEIRTASPKAKRAKEASSGSISLLSADNTLISVDWVDLRPNSAPPPHHALIEWPIFEQSNPFPSEWEDIPSFARGADASIDYCSGDGGFSFVYDESNSYVGTLSPSEGLIDEEASELAPILEGEDKVSLSARYAYQVAALFKKALFRSSDSFIHVDTRPGKAVHLGWENNAAGCELHLLMPKRVKRKERTN